MLSFIPAFLVTAVCVAIAWWLCRSFGNTNGNNRRTSAASETQRSPAEPTETGPFVYFADAPHGGSDREYRFHYKKVDGSWRAYILRMPDLRGRDAGGVATHRLFDGGRPYICWNTRVKTLKEMQTISRVWANNIQEYIATGKRFGPQ